ncbi:tetratricopeptide repeat protein [Micromonospora zhanjiangensis]|uniref:Tetratricopeptide repeat protein n=1 Tax=Micromonospora zhanjiangensis TaxID=1522057 RepID=A0ABV8KXM6_9ACTN
MNWFGVYDTAGAAAYPPVLDAVESALSRRATPLLASVAAALAPRWEELGQAREPADPSDADIPDKEEDDAEQRFLLYAAARAISQLGEGHGCAFSIGPGTEHSVQYFATELARLAVETGFVLAFSGRLSTMPGTLVRYVLPLPYRVGPPAATPVSAFGAADRRVLTVLAASKVGVPLAAATSLGLSPHTADLLTTSGPGDASWISLSGGARRRLWAGLRASDRRRCAGELFDAWPPQGWGYLRRAHLAVASGDHGRLRRQHAGLFAGCAIIGRELLQRHTAAIAAVVPVGDPLRTAETGAGTAMAISPGQRIAAHVAAARLAARLQPAERASRETVRHLRRARRLTTDEDSDRQLALTHQLANALAKQRTPAALAEARHLYERALRQTTALTGAVRRARLEIGLLNGLALVEYREGRDQAALDLEERAESLAHYLAEQQEMPSARWAFGLVGPNAAKLLLVRFGDRRRAIGKLATALEMTQSDTRLANKIRRDMARLVFAEEDYAEVVRLLDGVFSSIRPTDFGPAEEFHDRLLLAASQLKQNQTMACRTQLAPLRILAARIGGDTARSALSVLTRALGDAAELRSDPPYVGASLCHADR